MTSSAPLRTSERPSIPERRRVVVRADASADIGIGHVMRSLTLARELEAAGLKVTICGNGIPTSLAGRLGVVEPTHVDDARTVVDLQPDLVIVDGYRFTAEFFDALDDHGIDYVVIDDNGDTSAPHPLAVVNQNPHAAASMYAHLDGDPLLLLGTEFSLLRREIVEAGEVTSTQRNGAIFVAFGGSDPCRLTGSVAMQLAAAGFRVRVAIGALHPDRAELEELFAASEGITVIDPVDYATELANASGAVLAAGSSLLEAAHLGTPALAVIVADNQRLLAAAALDANLVCDVLVVDEHLAENLAAGMETLRHVAPIDPPAIPADGARRTAGALMALLDDQIRLRPASLDDADFLFALRTDDVVRRQSFHEPPDREHHLLWLRATIDDPTRRLMIIEAGSTRLGQLRLDTVGDHDVVSVAVVAAARGRGVARRALTAATAFGVDDLVAHIKPDNTASVKAFTAVGFVTEATGPDGIVMRWRRRALPDRVAP